MEIRVLLQFVSFCIRDSCNPDVRMYVFASEAEHFGGRTALANDSLKFSPRSAKLSQRLVVQNGNNQSD